jgi:hypothetical protein
VTIEVTVTVDELLAKIGQPVSWFRDDTSHVKRERYILETMQKKYPGKYTLEEYYSPEAMTFKYRLKFNSEADEMWFKLKYQ